MNGPNIMGISTSPAAALTPLGGSAPAMSSEAFAPFLAQAALGGGNIPGFAEANSPQKSPEALLSQTKLLSFWPTSFVVNGDTISTKQQEPLQDFLTDKKTEEMVSLNNEPAREEASACIQAIQQILTEFSLGSPIVPLSEGDLAQVTEILARIPELKQHLKPSQIQELQSLIQGITQGMETSGKISLNPPIPTAKDVQTLDTKAVDNPTFQLSQKLKELLKEQSPGSLMEKGQAFIKPQETMELNTQGSSQPFMDLILPLASKEASLQTQTQPTIEKGMTMPASLRENVFEQIVRSMNFSIKEGQSEMQIHLKPDFLGQMSMKIAVEDGLVAASFTVENHQVKELLESSLSNLRQSLTNQGLKVDTLTVNIGSGGAFSELSQRQSNWAASTAKNQATEEYREAETEIAQVRYDRDLNWTTGSMDYIV